MMEWIEFENGTRPMTWELWQSNMQNFDTLSLKGKEFIPEVVKTLSNILGSDYLKRCLIIEPKHPLFSVGYPMFNNVPIAINNLIELSVKLELGSKQRGWSRFRKEFTPNCSSKAWNHGMIQLEISGFAAKYGYACEFEPTLSTGKKGDITVHTQSGNLFFETVMLGTSDPFSKADIFYNSMTRFLYNVSMKYGFNIKGELKTYPNQEQQIDDILKQLLFIMNLMNFPRIGDSQLLNNEFVNLQITRSNTHSFPDLTGVHITTDSWHRLKRCIYEKGRQSSGALNVWLRIDEGSGMWAFTPWANKPLDEKMKLIVPLIKAELRPFEHVSGIILSNSSGIYANAEDNLSIVNNGNIAIRSVFPVNYFRETIIISRDKSARKAAREIAQWYLEEPHWLDWAMNHLEMPSISEIIE